MEVILPINFSLTLQSLSLPSNCEQVDCPDIDRSLLLQLLMQLFDKLRKCISVVRSVYHFDWWIPLLPSIAPIKVKEDPHLNWLKKSESSFLFQSFLGIIQRLKVVSSMKTIRELLILNFIICSTKDCYCNFIFRLFAFLIDNNRMAKRFNLFSLLEAKDFTMSKLQATEFFIYFMAFFNQS